MSYCKPIYRSAPQAAALHSKRSDRGLGREMAFLLPQRHDHTTVDPLVVD